MKVQEPRLLSVQEFANRVNRTERAIYKAIKAGRVNALKAEDGSAYQIPEDEVHNYGSASSGTVVVPVPERQNRVQEQVPEPSLNPEPVLARVQELVQEGFLGALERANEEIRRVERQKVELELQLRLHRNLLAENAESLMEKKVESDCYRQRADELAKRVTDLEQQNAELLQEQKRSWWSKIWSRRRGDPNQTRTA